MIFDTHCHLNHSDLYKDLDNLLSSAEKLGVSKFLVVGYNKESSFKAVELAHRYKNIYAAIGFHPTEIEDVSEKDFNDTLNLVLDKKVVAVGEIGLDYHWVKEPLKKEIQKEYFIRQIIFANEHKMPVSIHCREAIEDTLEIVRQYRPVAGGIMHCYSGSVETMREFIKLGFYISLGGPVTFKNAKTPKEVAEVVPLDKLLVETDAPYLAPDPLRGTTNKPENIRYVIDVISDIKKISKKHLAEATFKNACLLLGISDE